MYVSITRVDEEVDVYEITHETYEAMKADFGSELTKTYDTLPDGKTRIDWKNVKDLKSTETMPGLPVVSSPPPVFTEESMKDW